MYNRKIFANLSFKLNVWVLLIKKKKRGQLCQPTIFYNKSENVSGQTKQVFTGTHHVFSWSCVKYQI